MKTFYDCRALAQDFEIERKIVPRLGGGDELALTARWTAGDMPCAIAIALPIDTSPDDESIERRILADQCFSHVLESLAVHAVKETPRVESSAAA